jgi:hypothetical protein
VTEIARFDWKSGPFCPKAKEMEMRTNSQARCTFRSCIVRILVGLMLAAGCFRTADAADPSAITMQQIIKAWKKRQDHVHSLKYEWVVNSYQTKEFRERIDRLNKHVDFSPDGKEVTELEYDHRYVFYLDGIRTICETSGQTPSGRGDALVTPLDSRNVFDGKEYLRLQTVQAHEKGVTFQQADLFLTNEDLRNEIQLLPLVLTFRMLDERMQFFAPMETLRISPEPIVVDGRACIVVAGKLLSFWVDPEREFSIVAFNQLARDGGPILMQLQVSHEQHPEHGWVPSGWEWISQTSQGELKSRSTSTVIEYAINPVIPDEDFKIDIPVGALVIDVRDPDNVVDSIQVASGVRRKVNTSDSYTEMLAKARAPDAAPWQKRWLWLVAVNVLIALVIAGLIVYWKRRSAV